MLRFGTHTRERRYDPVPGVRILEREAPHKAMTRAGHEPIEVVDFFSGCGGASAGLREAGMRIRLGIDHDEQAGATYRRNFPEAGFIRRDIRRIATCELEPYIHRPRPLLFTACAPCQPFSKQNSEPSASDARATLLDDFTRFVRRFRPDYLFLENVPGIQRGDPLNGPIGRFVRRVKRLDYRVVWNVLDALDYGVPQTRRRFVLVAALGGEIRLPEETHGQGGRLAPPATAGEWIGDLPAIPEGGGDESVPNHRAARLSPLNRARIAKTPEGGDRRDWPGELVPSCHRGHDGHTDVYGLLRSDLPASTLTTRCISLPNGRFGHPTQDRALSLREAACLQTFPRDFVFSGGLHAMARQVGNAVPVLLARRVGEMLNAHLEANASSRGVQEAERPMRGAHP